MTTEEEFELDKLRAELAKERHMKLVVYGLLLLG
jgi:hypothetical protein